MRTWLTTVCPTGPFGFVARLDELGIGIQESHMSQGAPLDEPIMSTKVNVPLMHATKGERAPNARN